MVVTGHIYDTKDGTCLARIVNDTEVFDATMDGRQIGTVSNGNVYDMKGGLIGHLQPGGTFDDASTPEEFRKLVSGVSGN